ncbi:MAG: FeoB small GTPase domain-containing protein [Candidatus Coproplasma sp.]
MLSIIRAKATAGKREAARTEAAKAGAAITEAASFSVVLAGNPNAGKTTLFNALTHSHLRTGNFHGVTTSPAQKTVDGVTYIDVPGSYSFNAYTLEEDSATKAVLNADAVVCVIDGTTLPQSLNLAKKIIKANPHAVIYLTKLNLLKRRGGWVKIKELERLTGVPIYSDVKALRCGIAGGVARSAKPENIPLDVAYYGGNGKISRAEKLFYNKFFAVFFYVFALVLTFYMTFSPNMAGATLKGWLEELLCDKLATTLSRTIANPMLSSFVCEGIVGGVGGVLSFIPQLAILYLALILLDESGISSALTFVTDGLFERVGLSGRAAFSLVSGFGCTAAAISTTRGFAEDSSRKKTIAVLPFIPCGAKTPVFLTFLSPLFKNPFPAICLLYFGGVALAIAASEILKGKREGLISEVTPISLPSIQTVLKKLYFQIKSFIIKVTTYVFAFCVISWFISHFSFSSGFCSAEESIAGSLSRLICYLFYPMGITDWRIAYAALTGFAAKENVAATIAVLFPTGINLALAPTLALCVFFLCCPACISAFAASVREIGFKRTSLYNAAQLIFAFLVSYLTYFIIILL